MAKSLEVAAEMINKSISLARKNDDIRYFMDIVKLHNLMYLAQCYILSEYDCRFRLFSEEIFALSDYPYIDGLEWIPGKFGFEELTRPIRKDDRYGIGVFPLSYFRNYAIDFILKKYGTLSTKKLVGLAKNTYAYKKYMENYSEGAFIPSEDMKITGEELFGLKDPNFEYENFNTNYNDLIYCKNMCRTGKCPKIKKR